MGFDVDACSVGYDGSAVWMTPRCHYAHVKQHNSVDITRRSPTYEHRLTKYAKRGFEVLCPGLDRANVDPQIFEKPIEKLNGLQKLLLYEKEALDSATKKKEPEPVHQQMAFRRRRRRAMRGASGLILTK